jgi:phosphoglycerate dehydrogenase-like enzyme
LRLIHKIGIGLDAIDLDYAKQRGIAVCNMPGTNTSAVAEFALTLMLACLRRILPITCDVGTGGGWPARPEILGGLGEISGRTIGLVGYGAVAQRLSKTLSAMGANIVAYDPFLSSADIPLLELDSLLERSDIVSLHIPLTRETTNLFDKRRLGRMKRGSILINTARGPLVDEVALEEKLRLGDIAAAGLDVATEEPPRSGHPLRNLENVVMTPHLAWLTDETWRRSVVLIVENCRRLNAGSPLLHRVT